MIELDYNELDTSAKHLADRFVDHIRETFSRSGKSEVAAQAYNKLFDFLSADVPCEIGLSVSAFETCLNKSVVPKMPQAKRQSTSEDDIVGLMKTLNFTPYEESDAITTRDPQKQRERVEFEVNRCKDAIANRNDYYVQNLFENMLSLQADKNNIQVFQEYFEQLKGNTPSHNTCPIAIMGYLASLVDQSRRLQGQWMAESSLDVTQSLGKSLEKRRESKTEKNGPTFFKANFD